MGPHESSRPKPSTIVDLVVYSTMTPNRPELPAGASTQLEKLNYVLKAQLFVLNAAAYSSPICHQKDITSCSCAARAKRIGL